MICCHGSCIHIAIIYTNIMTGKKVTKVSAWIMSL